jgi:DegV family protein with EDD domain
MEEWNGRQFFDTFSSGASHVIKNQDHLNRINVFPVPDGDTGTNLAATLSHIVDNARVTDSIGETMESMSNAAIIGARGNSGVIFAQFLGGLSESLRSLARITREHFARAVRNARDRAYDALANPQEGTILSVISDWSHSLAEHARHSITFRELFERTLPTVEASLARTPEQLEVLKKSGVVDAGAQGFYHFLRGAYDFLSTGRKPHRDSTAAAVMDAVHEEVVSAEGVRYRYCTEVLLEPHGVTPSELRRELEPFGDSLIVAEVGGKARVHIHTDHPADVVMLLGGEGRLLQQKADDMRMQYETVYRRKHPIALVTDSCCDLPREILDEHQVHVIPLRILFGETEYLDRVTITPGQFARLQRRARPYPSTSQPPLADLRRAYAFLAGRYDSIIALHVSGKMSGTFAVSAREAERITGKKITVIDSRHLSGSLGLLVLRAAEAIAAGESHDEIVRRIESWIPKARILVSVKSLDYMVRGGRVSPLKGLAAKLLNLKPIVSVDGDGNSLLYGKAFSSRANLGKILRMVSADLRERPLHSYGVVHAGVPEKARAFADRLEAMTGMKPRFVMEITPVVSLNSGPAAISVVTMGE